MYSYSLNIAVNVNAAQATMANIGGADLRFRSLQRDIITN